MAAKYTVKTHKVKKLDAEGNPIKNEKGKYIWENVERTYRIDAGFKPASIDEICIEFIDNYIEANNKGEWFMEVSEGKENFMSIRSEFAKEFFSEIVKGTGKKEPSYIEKMRKKYGK